MNEQQIGITIIVVIVLFCIQMYFNFDVDYTREGEMLLWYNYKNTRKYIKIH